MTEKWKATLHHVMSSSRPCVIILSIHDWRQDASPIQRYLCYEERDMAWLGLRATFSTWNLMHLLYQKNYPSYLPSLFDILPIDLIVPRHVSSTRFGY